MKNFKLNGFSLVEVIVAVGIFSLILYGTIALVSSILVGSSQQSNLLASSDSARKVSATVIRELRNAVTSATGAYALAQAADQQVIFYTNTGTTIDRIRYYISNGSLYRGVIIPSGNPFVYNIAGEVVTLVQKDIANGATPLFYYYDGNYDGTAGSNPLTQPVNVTAVTFVKLNLMIYRRINQSGTAFYTLTASGAIRNLKTNLGD